MKKTILLLTVIALLAGLCACGNGNNEGDPSGTSLTNSSGDVVPGSSSGNQDSGDVVPGSSSGNQDKDDPSSQASSSPADDSDWGSDEFTANVPKPECGVFQSKTLSKTGSLMTISYTGVTYDQAEAYRTMVVKSGFSENTSEMSTEETIMFYADDADGRFNVGVGFSDGKLVIMILKY